MPLDSIQEVIDQGGTVGMGSTDVGDVSWVVPTTGFNAACFVPGTPGHSWQVVASGGSSIGRKGMNLAARVLAATAWDLYTQPKLLKAAQARTSGTARRPPIPDINAHQVRNLHWTTVGPVRDGEGIPFNTHFSSSMKEVVKNKTVIKDSTSLTKPLFRALS